MEVIPKRMETATTPGSRDWMLSNLPPDLMKNIPVQASEHVDGGGLACAVWAQETEKFTPTYLEAHIRNSLDLTEALGQSLDGYCRSRCHPSSSAPKGSGPLRTKALSRPHSFFSFLPFSPLRKDAFSHPHGTP
jgi:hypothetical protein